MKNTTSVVIIDRNADAYLVNLVNHIMPTPCRINPLLANW